MSSTAVANPATLSTPPSPHPQQGPILSFSHTFPPKSVHTGGRRPPMGRPPPQREILDLQPREWI